MKTLLANTSSFCTSSPWTFVLPVLPRMSSTRPAWATWAATTFAAKMIWLNMELKSPLPPYLLCSSMICRSKEMMVSFIVPPLHEADSGVQGETNTIHDTFWVIKNQDDQRGLQRG